MSVGDSITTILAVVVVKCSPSTPTLKSSRLDKNKTKRIEAGKWPIKKLGWDLKISSRHGLS